MSQLRRRQFIGLGGAAALAVGVAGCGGGGGGGAGSASLRVAWYGGQPVHDGLEEALAEFSEAHSELALSTEQASFDDYWDRLATQVAGGEGPDVLRMSMTWLADYADRGALADLSEYEGGLIDTAALDDDAVEGGRMDTGLYGVGQSSITQATFGNTRLAEEYGVELPAVWTWEDFVQVSKEFADAAGPGMYGTTDAGGNFQMFEVWARQHGTELFAGESLAVSAEIIEEWLVMWQDLRDAGAAPQPDVTAESDTFETSQLSQLNAVVSFGWVQQVTFLQPIIPDHPLEILDMPGSMAGDRSGQFLSALDFWCLTSSAGAPEAAADLIDFLVNDEGAARSIGLALGVPPSETGREALGADPDSAEGRAVAYVESLQGETGPPPAPWPSGYGDVEGTAFPRMNEEVGFGEKTPSEAAGEFLEAGQRALG